MSMKRSKPVSRAPNSNSASDSGFPKKHERIWEWKTDVATITDDSFVPYALTSRFQSGTLIAHPKFGRGIVTLVEGARIEVLFEEGQKKLGHCG